MTSSAALSTTPETKSDVKVAVEGVKIATVKYKDYANQTGETPDRWLVVSLRITNTSSVRKIEYDSFKSFSINDTEISKAFDEHGNAYRVQDWFNKDAEGSIHNATIYPGKSANDVIIFERPVDAAKSLTLILPGRHVGEKHPIQVKLQLGLTASKQ